MKTELLVDGLHFPEGPRRFGGERSGGGRFEEGIVFSDFYRYEVLHVDLSGKLQTVCSVENQPSGLGFQPDGDLWIVSMTDRRLLSLSVEDLQSGKEGATLREVADLSSLAPSVCNDMVVDGLGRAYVGNFGFERHEGEEPRSTNLIRVDPEGGACVVAEGLEFPNGTVITPDGGTLIVAESRGKRLTAFRVGENGELVHRRLWADLDPMVPDGISLDAEGAIWVADPRQGGVHRVHEGGRVSAVVETPGHNAYACMLGGPGKQTLFVCTAKFSGPDAMTTKTGRIEVAEVQVPAAGWP